MKSILVVEDDHLLQEVLVELFKDHKWEVSWASNGLEALEILKDKSFDVILSDINMPKMNGLKFLMHLSEENCPTPVIFLSGFRDMEKMKVAWQYSVFDFVDKPFDSQDLLLLCDNAKQFGREYVELARRRFEKFNKSKKSAA